MPGTGGGPATQSGGRPSCRTGALESRRSPNFRSCGRPEQTGRGSQAGGNASPLATRTSAPAGSRRGEAAGTRISGGAAAFTTGTARPRGGDGCAWQAARAAECGSRRSRPSFLRLPRAKPCSSGAKLSRSRTLRKRGADVLSPNSLAFGASGHCQYHLGDLRERAPGEQGGPVQPRPRPLRSPSR